MRPAGLCCVLPFLTIAGAAAGQQPAETVLTATAVLQQCTATETTCTSGPMNNLVGIRIARGAAAVRDRVGALLMVVGTADTIPAPCGPPANSPPDSELARIIARAGLVRSDSVTTAAPPPPEEPPPGVQSAPAQPVPFARVYAQRTASTAPPGFALMVFDITALRRHPRFEPSRTVRILWTGADGTPYAAVVRVP